MTKDAKSYVTLPRRLPSTSASSASPTQMAMMDWNIVTDQGPVYDGVGPRTSATGASAGQKTDNPAKMASIPELDEQVSIL